MVLQVGLGRGASAPANRMAFGTAVELVHNNSVRADLRGINRGKVRFMLWVILQCRTAANAGGFCAPGADLSRWSLGSFALLSCLTWLLMTSVTLAGGIQDEVNSFDASGLIQLGPGDSVRIEVYGQPAMTTTVYVGDDGTIRVPLVDHPVTVSGLSAVNAGKKVEEALKVGGYLNDPHVTLALLQSRSQRVAVMGKVHKPDRYTIDPKTTLFDLLAQAGGITEDGANYAYLLRADVPGGPQKIVAKLGGFTSASESVPMQSLQGGDTLFVPPAEKFYIYGEVATPSVYRLEPGMTVLQAIARAGGITPRGSERRVQIKRPTKDSKDGHYVILHAKPDDLIQPDDVIFVKESIF